MPNSIWVEFYAGDPRMVTMSGAFYLPNVPRVGDDVMLHLRGNVSPKRVDGRVVRVTWRIHETPPGHLSQLAVIVELEQPNA